MLRYICPVHALLLVGGTACHSLPLAILHAGGDLMRLHLRFAEGGALSLSPLLQCRTSWCQCSGRNLRFSQGKRLHALSSSKTSPPFIATRGLRLRIPTLAPMGKEETAGSWKSRDEVRWMGCETVRRQVQG